MTDFFPTEGLIEEGVIFSLLHHLYKNSVSGVLVVTTEELEKRLVIEDRKIVFASSSLRSDSFSDYLLKHNVIDRSAFENASRYAANNNKRFGRSLIELGYLDYEKLWKWMPEHLKSIVFSIFRIQSGKYRILPDYEQEIENISLELDILGVLVEGVRLFRSVEFLENFFENIDNLYVRNPDIIGLMPLKPYEKHVFQLVKRESDLVEILRSSELMEFDTLRLLYLFLLVDAISTRPGESKDVPDSFPEEQVPAVSTFTSFEEALRYYNLKFELIYKTLSKEIGPIALSLLSRAIDDIMENLPPYFQKMHLASGGGIEEDTFIKTLWYHDFKKNIGGFLQGLEEILYTQMYVVRKHLGREYEQQVLKWLNGIDN